MPIIMEFVMGPKHNSPEELKARRKQFNLIEEGKLCISPGFGGPLYFIAIKKISNDEWQAVRLTSDNNIKLLSQKKCKQITLHFKDCWGLHFSNEEAHW